MTSVQVSQSQQSVGRDGTVFTIEGVRIPSDPHEPCGKLEFDRTIFRIVQNSRHHTVLASIISEHKLWQSKFDEVKRCTDCGGSFSCPPKLCKGTRGTSKSPCRDFICAEEWQDGDTCIKPRVFLAPTNRAIQTFKDEMLCENERFDLDSHVGYMYQQLCRRYCKPREEYNYIYSYEHLVTQLKQKTQKTRNVWFKNKNGNEYIIERTGDGKIVIQRQIITDRGRENIQIGRILPPALLEMSKPTSDMFAYDGVVHSVDVIFLPTPKCSGGQCVACEGMSCAPDRRKLMVKGLRSDQRCKFRQSALDFFKTKYRSEHARFRFVRQKKDEWKVEYTLYFSNSDLRRDGTVLYVVGWSGLSA